MGGDSLSPCCASFPQTRAACGQRTPSPLGVALVVIVSALLVGCGESRSVPPEDGSRPPAAGTPVITTAPRPEASPVPVLGEIVWAASGDPESNAPQETVSTFGPETPRIAAFVLANALPAGSVVAATWEYNNTPLETFARQIVVPAVTDQTWISFHIDRAETDRWPVGLYEITITLDGQMAQQSEVEVVAPA